VGQRVGARGRVGFHKPGEILSSKEAQTAELLSEVIADDLLQYGMIRSSWGVCRSP